jgi:hypothetical protein
MLGDAGDWRSASSVAEGAHREGRHLRRRSLAIGFDPMAIGKSFTIDEAREIGEQIGIDWSSAPFGVEEFRAGMDVELEHGLHDPATNVTDDDPVVTGRIALAHLNEFADYYTRLERMEREAEREQGGS